MASRRRRWALWGGCVGAVVAGVAVSWWVRSPVPTAQAPPLVLSDLAGQMRRLADWRGKVLVVNFWGTWCTPCLEEVPVFDALARTFRAQGVEFVGIAIDAPEPVRAFVQQHRIGYPMLLGDSAVALAWMHAAGNTAGGLPFTVLLDRGGRIVEVHLGPLAAEILRAKLAPLVAQSE